MREQREEMLAAAESGDPSAFIALAAIVNDLRKVHERLERTADAAEQDNQRLAVASLSSQQLRTAEVRAKIGGVGGYAAPRVREGEGAPVFALTINLPGQTERIVATAEPIGGPPTLEVDAGPVGPRSVFRIPAMLPDEPRRADPKVSNEFGARSTSCSISATKLSLLKPDLADCANGLGRDPAGTPSWSPRRVGYSVS